MQNMLNLVPHAREAVWLWYLVLCCSLCFIYYEARVNNVVLFLFSLLQEILHFHLHFHFKHQFKFVIGILWYTEYFHFYLLCTYIKFKRMN